MFLTFLRRSNSTNVWCFFMSGATSSCGWFILPDRNFSHHCYTEPSSSISSPMICWYPLLPPLACSSVWTHKGKSSMCCLRPSCVYALTLIVNDSQGRIFKLHDQHHLRHLTLIRSIKIASSHCATFHLQQPNIYQYWKSILYNLS